MSYRSQNAAIRGLRSKYPTVGQRTLAQAIVSRSHILFSTKDRVNFIDSNNLVARTFASVYGVIRRHDNNEKAKAATPVLA